MLAAMSSWLTNEMLDNGLTQGEAEEVWRDIARTYLVNIKRGEE